MQHAFDFINDAGEQWVRAVFGGDITRADAAGRAEDLGYSKTSGRRAHRFIRGHEDVEFLVAAYLKSQAYKREVEAEVVFDDRNEASATLHYPNGRPPENVDELFEEHGVDMDEWVIERKKVNSWPTTGKLKGAWYQIRNPQVDVRLVRENLEPTPQMPSPIEAHAGRVPAEPSEGSPGVCPDGWKTALVVPDRHIGFRRVEGGRLWPIHGREAMDLAVQVAGRLRPDTIVDLGDRLDLAPFKDLNDNPDLKHLLEPALAETWFHDTRLRKAGRPERFIAIEGNHDERVREVIAEKLPEFYGLRSAETIRNGGAPVVSLETLCDMPSNEIEWHEGYPDNQVMLNRGLAAEHGDVAKSDSGHTVYYQLKHSLTDYSRLMGHIHRIERAWKTVWKSRQRWELTAASFGTLAKVTGGVPGVKDRQNWQQALGVVHYDPEGRDHVIEDMIHIWPAEHTQHDTAECRFRGETLRADPPGLETRSDASGYDFT
jgi:predicted phosphodiesterase